MCGSTEMTGAATGPATAASSASIEAPPTMARCGLSAAWGDTTRPAPLRPPRLRSPSSPHYATVCTRAVGGRRGRRRAGTHPARPALGPTRAEACTRAQPRARQRGRASCACGSVPLRNSRNCARGVFRAPPGIAAAGRARRGPWCGWRGALALCAALVLTPPGATLRTVHT